MPLAGRICLCANNAFYDGKSACKQRRFVLQYLVDGGKLPRPLACQKDFFDKLTRRPLATTVCQRAARIYIFSRC